MRTRVGYAGGTKAAPTYHAMGDHSEAIEIVFDPARISYEQLLDLFWESHDPRHKIGSRQYRSAAFPEGPEQKRIAEASRDRVASRLGAPVATDLEPLTTFTPAEDYHQKYYMRRSRDLVRDLVALTGDERAFIDSTAAARLNAYFGNDAQAAAVSAELTALGLEPNTVDQLMKRIRRTAGDS